MTTGPATDEVISAAHPEAPLDLGPYRVKPEVPPFRNNTMPPALRRGLMDLGARLSLVMAARNKMPEDIQDETGVKFELIEQIRAGTEPDVSILTLTKLCSALGLGFQFGIPNPPPASGAD